VGVLLFVLREIGVETLESQSIITSFQILIKD